MYYPKNQILTDQYTEGDSLVYANSSQDFYVGYYFQTSDGKIFTGRNPNDKPNNELKAQVETPGGDAELDGIGTYTEDTNEFVLPVFYMVNKKINPFAIPPSRPIQSIPLPTSQNYEVGEFQRYFTSKMNEVQYTEISKSLYTRFIKRQNTVDWGLYTAFTIPWLISGKRNDVYNINQKTVERIQNNNLLSGFKSYFKNVYDQYFRYSPGENLKTDGSEFLIERSNKPYIGLYHIHPTKGPMVGAEHTNIPHDYLIPVSGSNIQYKINKTETQRSNRMGGGY
jgi:hypothetical protein